MKDFHFVIHPTENFVMITRMVQTGTDPQTGEAIFHRSDICRETLTLAINEVRASLDRLLEEERRKGKKPPAIVPA